MKIQPDADFFFQSAQFSISKLDETNLAEIEELLDACSDFSQLVSGQPPQPAEAMGLLYDLPPDTNMEDKAVFAIRDPRARLLGVLDAVRNYPEEHIYFIGLLLLRPECRGKRMGSGIMNAFSEYARRQGFTSLMLGVVEDNAAGLHFWQVCGFEIVETSPPKPFGQKMQRVFKMQIFL